MEINRLPQGRIKFFPAFIESRVRHGFPFGNYLSLRVQAVGFPISVFA